MDEELIEGPLHAVTIWRRLAVMLALHEKLVMENRDKLGMARAARKIKRLISLLEGGNK